MNIYSNGRGIDIKFQLCIELGHTVFSMNTLDPNPAQFLTSVVYVVFLALRRTTSIKCDGKYFGI